MKNVLAVNTRRNHAALIPAKRLFPIETAAGILLIACSILLPAPAVAQTVSVGTVSGLAGTAVDLAVNFTAGASGVATLQFDLALPASLGVVSTSTGTAATNAGKSANGSSFSGGVRILLFGLNQNIVGSGQIAIVRLNIAGGTSPGAQVITVGNLTASDALGGNISASGTNGSVTVTAPPDITAPVITGVIDSRVTQTGATISWTTDEAADSQVDYGTNPSCSTATPLNVVPSTYHAQTISGLTADTLYHYRVKSRDAAGNLATSGDYSFITAITPAPPDVTPPVVSGVTSSNVTSASATISWTTNEAADTQVVYGTTTSYGSLTSLNTQLTTSHSQALAGLASGTLYHYRVQSRDGAGNLAVSQDNSFTTLVSYATTLFYPRMLTTSSAQQDPQDPEFLGFGIANLDSQPATLRFTAYNSAGAQLSGTGITNPVTRVLQPGAQLPIANSDYDLFGVRSTGTDSSGWVKIESTVSRVAGFFLMFNGQLTELDGVDMADTPVTSFVFSQIKNDGFNRINISNPNGDPATLTFSLMGADGTLQASASRDIPAYGALVADLANDIFPGFAPDTTKYVKVTSTRSVLPLELLGKPSLDIESLRGQDATLGGTTLYCPQYVVGGTWRSALSIVNLDSMPAGVALRFIGDDASQIGATRVLQIAPYGKILIDDPAFFQQPADPQTVSSGYVEITSSGLFFGGIRMTGSVAFADGAGDLETALPLNTSLDQSIVFSHVSSNNQYWTGVAIVNPNYADARLTVALYNQDGTLALTTNLMIPARHRISELLTQIFPALAGQQRFSGYFRVTSDVGVASFAAFGTNSVSLISAIPAQILR